MTEIFPSLRKQNGSNDIVNVYSLNDSGIPISPEANRTMLGSARCYRDVDVTEGMSFTHCQKINTNRDEPTIFTSEGEYQTHYNKTIGPLTKNKSIPDGSIIIDNKINLLSVFRLTKINEGYIFRKIEKLFYVAYHEYDESTSLFYSKYPNEKIDEIILHFYIWLPDVIKVNKVKNILKKVYRKTVDKIPQFLKIQYNIFQTFGSKMKHHCWSICDNVYMYGSYYETTCKDKKLKRIKDIEDVLILFFNNEIIEHIFADTFLNETLLDDSFFYV
tara:strand:+ start:95 stop:916 length:822 start_codon:yes stop_codon:yes gene_type:complete